MPTDLALSTNTATGALELRQAQPMPDGSGFAAFLVVRSGGFAAALPYFVTTGAWREFASALDRVTAGDGKPARLRARNSDDFVAITGGGDGLLSVFGSLHEPDDDQLLRFRFMTPAHGLAPFAAGVRRLADAG